MDLGKCGCGIIKQVFSEQECLTVIEDLELNMSAMPDGSIKNGRDAYLGGRNLLTWWDGCLGIARCQDKHFCDSGSGNACGPRTRPLF